MNKHAYLIMAHGNWQVLEKMMELLDDERNDFFLHLDSSHGAIPDPTKWITKSTVTIIEENCIRWADYSQIDTELQLFKKAYLSRNGYSFYHLLSGSDFPIKPKNYIYDFFENNIGKNYIGIVPYETEYSLNHVRYYHLFTGMRGYRNSKMLKGLDRVLQYAQKMVGINRLKEANLRMVDGWAWVSISPDYLLYILKNEHKIRSIFSKSIASDEMALQTMAFNDPRWYATLACTEDLKQGSMRFIDWQRGKPYTWGQDQSDYEILMKSPYIFARKFDQKYMWIVDQIYNDLCGSSKNDE